MVVFQAVHADFIFKRISILCFVYLFSVTGKSLEAVFNKETGRWEFPGEVRKSIFFSII